MLEIIDLDVYHTDHTLLSGVSFTLNSGELIHIQGANGVGKTTLLNILAGIYLPDNGSVMFNNQLIHHDLPGYQRQLCYVGHKTGVSQHLTPRTHCRFDLNIDPLTAEKWLSNINLMEHADLPCGQLSYGQRKLVGLLRLNLELKKLWLLDEPFVGLDASAVQSLVLQIQAHLAVGGMIVLTSHQTIPQTLTNYSSYIL